MIRVGQNIFNCNSQIVIVPYFYIPFHISRFEDFWSQNPRSEYFFILLACFPEVSHFHNFVTKQ